ncbi:DUF1415 domain-containing protein [Flavihumibacter petaseus]|uniref:DUF1415 domain-containing protein n=1 Tax=Flavihumibacter petaseus NBRC 106054 TaxID=1220578 RepID=A0A0E9N1C1_9BACT|nr:DUF1415 domain-containing protein [Flavihumibacter petaseus]GAO43436.1 hypothetical protein FPE01S_02_05410 [Flavihumibacter petaseus NBRC 106054]
MNEETIIQHTRRWIEDVVIGCNFCPFAKREMDRGTIFYRVVSDAPDLFLLLREEMERLDNTPALETTLIILPEQLTAFTDYLDMLYQLEDFLIQEEYEGIYQLASFHPQYKFEGSTADDPANFTNRSPYPMFHLLREESIEKALEFYPDDPDDIPDRNIRFARQKGLAYMEVLRKACFE